MRIGILTQHSPLNTVERELHKEVEPTILESTDSMRWSNQKTRSMAAGPEGSKDIVS